MRKFLSRLIFPRVRVIALAVLPGRAWAQLSLWVRETLPTALGGFS